MASLYYDSFDNYTSLLSRYDSIGDNAIRTAGQSRTGIGCVQITSGAIGPAKTVSQVQQMLVASAYYSSGAGTIFVLGNEGGGNPTQSSCVELKLENDQSLGVYRGASAGGTQLGQSAASLYQLNTYNSVAFQATVSAAATVRVWLNGVLILTLTGVDTRNLHNPARTYLDAFALYGPPGNGQTAYHDDVYVLDCTTGINVTYLGARRIYASPPIADVAVTWTPTPGAPNYANVDEIPPDGVAFNSSATIGQVDQYSHPLNGSLPANSSISGIQHCQSLLVDSGSRSVASSMAGVTNATAFALSAGYKIYTWPYDLNPATVAAWDQVADFPVAAGPAVTA